MASENGDRAASPGALLRTAIAEERPLQIVGVINAYSALLASRAGFRALYLSGAGVSNANLGLPDLGVMSIPDVVAEARHITAAANLPLLVDCDTGWGSPLTIRRAVRELSGVGVAGIHIEDQVDSKRCGHRDGKRLVSGQVMCERIVAAVEAKPQPDFVVMARTDAYSVEGLDEAIDRAQQYVEVGADAVFAEAMSCIEDYQRFTAAVRVPVLANMTEFGKTPLLDVQALRAANIAMALYPLSAFRAMNQAAKRVFAAIREEGTQKNVVDLMETRDELYEVLDYLTEEQKIDMKNERTGETS